MSDQDPVGAILVRATDLMDVQSLLVEIRAQNMAMREELRRDRTAAQAHATDHECRLGRLERQVRWMGVALIVAIALGFGAGWVWRGEHHPAVQAIP